MADSGDTNRRVTSGQPVRLKAAEFNGWQEAAADLKRRQHAGGALTGGGGGGVQTVLVRNDSGGDLDRFSVVAIGAPIITPDDNLAEFCRIPPFAADLPAATTDVVAILQEPLAIGAYGHAMLAGVSPVLLTVTAAGDKYAAPAGSSGRLVTGPTGPWRVIYAETAGSASGPWDVLGVVVAAGGAGSSVLVKITANAAGGGKYTGCILTGASTAVAAGDEGQPEGMTVPGADDCLILNTEENGLSTHWLAVDSYAVGKITGFGEAGSGSGTELTVVEITGGIARTDSPQELMAGSGAEGSEAADGATWDRALSPGSGSGTSYGDTPVAFWVVCRTVYNDAGDEILYAMLRHLTFAADGRLASISAETRVEVDVPEEDCSGS